MSDEFESRLSDGLARRAGHLPRFEGDLGAIRRRGRNRRWATRGAGAVGALALLGGGIAIATSLQDDATSSVATDGGEIEAFVPTPTPTPTPTPEPTPQATPAEDDSDATATPNPLDVPAGPDGPDDARILVATGWGVGILNGTGAIFAPETCCTADELRWYDQPADASAEGLGGAVSARDDLRGGYVFASRNALYWKPAAYLADGLQPLRLDLAGTGVNGELRLWDVGEIDGEVTVLYSTTIVSVGDNQTTSELRSKRLDGTAAATAPTVLDDFSSSADDAAAAEWKGAAWLPTGQVVELVERNGCAAITAPGVDPFPSPYPEVDAAADDCPHPSISAMTVSDDGSTLALVRGHVEEEPVLAVYDLGSAGAPPPTTIGLEAGKEAQGEWSEIDLAGTKVLLSRGRGMADDSWANLDEIQVIDIEEGTPPQALIYFGAPAFARSTISTLGLPALPPGDPLAFYGSGLAPPPQPEPDPQPTPDPNAAPDPTPAPDPEPAPEVIADEARVAVGRNVNIVDDDALAGADGCLGPSLGSVCAGWSFDEASAALTLAFGAGERTDDPATFLEGEPHPADTHVWADAARRVTIVQRNGTVTELSVNPESPDGLTSPLVADLTIGDVLRALGPPAQLFQGGGEGIEVVVLEYDTETGRVTYEYLESWGSPTRLIDQGGPLEKIPADYDELPINGFSATQVG